MSPLALEPALDEKMCHLSFRLGHTHLARCEEKQRLSILILVSTNFSLELAQSISHTSILLRDFWGMSIWNSSHLHDRSEFDSFDLFVDFLCKDQFQSVVESRFDLIKISTVVEKDFDVGIEVRFRSTWWIWSLVPSLEWVEDFVRPTGAVAFVSQWHLSHPFISMIQKHFDSGNFANQS